MVELPPAGGLEGGAVAVAAVLGVAEDKDKDVRQLETREIRQTEVIFMVLSPFVT